MRRRLLGLLSAAALVLCVATCVLWARSHGTTDQLALRRADGGLEQITFWRGDVVYRHVDPVPFASTDGRGLALSSAPAGSLTAVPSFSGHEVVQRRGPFRYDVVSAATVRRVNPPADGVPVATAVYDAAVVDRDRAAAAALAWVGGPGFEREEVDLRHKIAEIVVLYRRGELQAATRLADAGSPRWQWVVPAWAAAVVLAVLPALWAGPLVRRAMVRRRRRSKGLCFACGYDLRATPNGCPECGAGATRGTP